MKNTKSVNQPKKPIYKQWWFWVILVVIIAICGGALNGVEEEQQPTTSSTSQPNTNTSAQENTTPTQPQTPGIGDAVKAGDLEVTVKSVDRNYVANYAKPSEGMEYIKINLSIKNVSNDMSSFNALHFKIENDNGAIETYTNATMAQADDSLGHGDLAAGGTKDGSIVFEVPAGDTNLKLHVYENGFGSKILGTIDLGH